MGRRAYIYWYPLLLALAWAGAWMAARHWDLTADTAYWIGMKFLLWLLPVFALIRVVEHAGIAEFLEFRNPGKGVLWGVAAALILLTADYLLVASRAGKHLAAPVCNAVLLNAVVMAPFTEEIVFRGFVQRRLRMNGVAFWSANLLASAAFLLMHLVGWFFQSKLGSVAEVARMLAPLLFLSLVLGWLKHKTGSLYAPLALHLLNNLYASASRASR